ncbi:MAG: kynureninase [Armatimonadota bacterium]
MELDLSEVGAARWDRNDPLAVFRERFCVPPETIYLDGNSLGLLAREAETSLRRVMDEWRALAVDGWTEAGPPWFGLAERLAEEMAPLVGAEPGEVAVTGSTTGNLHQLLATLYRPAGARRKILIDALAFPSDVYAVESHLRLRGLDPAEALVKVPSRDGLTLDEGEILDHLTSEVQTAVLPSVLFTSGQLLDLPRLAAAARERGVLLGLDCSHSAGVVPHRLHEWGVDFAFWCGYKYLNGGPGAAAALFLHRRYHGRAPGLAGWWGSDKSRQFDMASTFTPAADAGALQIGTPHLLSLAPLEGALRITREAGLERIREKSLRLTAYLIALADAHLSELGFRLATPREEARRGGHVALRHPEAARICKALKAARIVPDFRPPNLVRLAPVPLYNSFQECRAAVLALERIVRERRYEAFPAGRGLVA